MSGVASRRHGGAMRNMNRTNGWRCKTDASRLIMTYAMCGFANFGSLGILVGGMGAMAPGRRSEIVALGMRSLVSGTLATLMTGAVVGIFL